MVVFEHRHHLPHVGTGGFLLPGREIIFILYIIEVGQGSGSLERRGVYNLFIFLMCFAFQIIHVSVVHLCFHVFNNHMLHMLIDHMFHIAMNMFDIIIFIINNLLYVIVIMLIMKLK